MYEKSGLCVHKSFVTKLLLEKSAKSKKNKSYKPWKRSQSLADSTDKTSFFMYISETTFSKQFSLNNYFFVFYSTLQNI